MLVCGSTQSRYAACGHAPNTAYTSFIYAINRQPPVKIVGAPPGEWDARMKRPGGFWVSDRVFVSPDGRTLLAQWSGLCETQSTYLISIQGGKPRAVFKSESYARGWSKDGRARVFLAEHGVLKGEYGYKPGLYLVNPKTMKRTLVRPAKTRHGC